LVREPVSPWALASALQVSTRGCRSRRNKSASTHPLVDFSVPPECVPISPSPALRLRRTTPRLLSWALVPFNTCWRRRSTCRGACLPRYVPPSGFGYPPDGLLPSTPRRACFIPTALVGFFPSERSPLAEWRCVLRTNRTRMTLDRRILWQANPPAGTPIYVFRALTPRKSSLPDAGCLARIQPDAPLGFAPSKASHRLPCPGFHPELPLRALRNAAALTAAPPAP